MNSSEHYQKKLSLAQVDKNNQITGQIERWQAHKENVLHRGYTVILIYKNQFILQHRKHLVFNKCYDLSFSSHQTYRDQTLQSDVEAIDEGLIREWNITQKDLVTPLIKKGHIYYQAKDPDSEFSEHEIDIIYQAELKNLPQPNLEYCFGFELMNKEIILTGKSPITNFTPWVKVILHNNLIK